jgi:hypothetical protein
MFHGTPTTVSYTHSIVNIPLIVANLQWLEIVPGTTWMRRNNTEQRKHTRVSDVGFAGATAAQTLTKAVVEVTLVDRKDYFEVTFAAKLAGNLIGQQKGVAQLPFGTVTRKLIINMKNNAEDCIKKEDEEETGYKLDKVEKLFEAYMSLQYAQLKSLCR